MHLFSGLEDLVLGAGDSSYEVYDVKNCSICTDIEEDFLQCPRTSRCIANVQEPGGRKHRFLQLGAC